MSEEALSLISSAERRYRHLSEFEVPDLRKCTGPLTVQQTLAEEVRGSTMLLTQQIQVNVVVFFTIYPLLINQGIARTLKCW